MEYTQCDLEYGMCQLHPDLADVFGHDQHGHSAVNRVARHFTTVGDCRPLPPREELWKKVGELTDEEIDNIHQVGPLLAARVKESRDKIKKGENDA